MQASFDAMAASRRKRSTGSFLKAPLYLLTYSLKAKEARYDTLGDLEPTPLKQKSNTLILGQLW
jgi:hypothetical protein